MTKFNSNPRQLVLTILNKVLFQGKFLVVELDLCLKKNPIEAKDRGLLTQLVYGVVREKGYLDYVLSSYISLKKTPNRLKNLLRLGAYQILCLDKVPDHAAVFETVEMAKIEMGSALGKLVNAVLRRIQKERSSLAQDRQRIQEDLKPNQETPREAAREKHWVLSFPPWLLERWLKRFNSAQVVDLARYFNHPAPVYLRVHPNRANISALENKFRGNSNGSLRVPNAPFLKLNGHPQNLGSFINEGKVSLQDLGSYRVIEVLKPQIAETGLDACSGHGGKASAIVEMTGKADKLFVYDVVKEKLKELKDNFSRLGLSEPNFLKGARSAQVKKLSFDWILIDAPCSGLGTVGRKPEIRWRIKATELRRLNKMQQKILNQWAPFVKPGGRLVYAVCSFEPEESSEVLQAFLNKHPEFREDFSQTYFPFEHSHDGFFVARLLKAST